MNIFEYDNAVKLMRQFFQDVKGFTEVPSQSRRSILAACEDPATISKYEFNGTVWPLPQTGQMWLEKELLENPELPGVFCITTSYRNEPNPIEGRHEKIFPMFEFESHGNMQDMIELEKELLDFLGFNKNKTIIEYDSACEVVSRHTKETCKILDAEEEEILQDKLSNVLFVKDFPKRANPFWNMKQHPGGRHFYKVDVLLYGMETIGSAERSCSVEEMREMFHTNSNGEYAQLLFDQFGTERVEKELEEYLALDMFPRFGGGIGVTRMVRALKLLGEE